MTSQYPHTVVLTVRSWNTKDSNGNWTAGTETVTEIKGRYEPSSGNGMIAAADGTRIHYDGIVYLPLPQSTLAPGTAVVIKNGAEVLLQGKIKRFSAGQLNARIWL